MENREEAKIICTHCHSSQFIKYGWQKNIQKYKCKNEQCRKYFLERKKRIRYNPEQKKFLSMLVNFLKPQDNLEMPPKEAMEKVLGDAIANMDTNNKDLSKYQLVLQSKKCIKKIDCYNPRLLICEDENKDIVLYSFGERVFEGKKKTRYITIEDSDDFMNMRTFF